MSDNPFAQPEAHVLPPGELDVAFVVQDALRLVLGGAAAVIGGLFLAGLIYMGSACTCIGVFITLPIFTLGLPNLFLRAADGKAEASDVMRPLDLFPMWYLGVGVIIFGMIVAIPGFLASMGVGAVAAMLGDGVVNPVITQLAGQAAMIAWSLVTVRFCFLPYLLIEGEDFGPAIEQTLSMTGPVWFKLMILIILLQLLNAPTLFGTAYLSVFMESINPALIDQHFGTLIPLYIVIFGGSIVMMVAQYSILASAYRQLRPMADD